MEETFLKDVKATILVEQLEIDKLLTRFFLKRSYSLYSKINSEDAFLARFVLQKIKNDHLREGSLARVANRSPFTGRSRGYYRYAKMGRMEFKQYSSSGALPGFRKSSW